MKASYPVIGPGAIPWQNEDARYLAPSTPEAFPVGPAVVGGPGAWLQGESSALVATVDGTTGPFGYGRAVTPPDAVRSPWPEAQSRAALAPPHAGSFAFGGPDAPPGSGIGARAFPVPGSDGVKRWRPADDAAKRTEASDLDAFREPLPLRMPPAGIEGDVGPGVAPFELAVPSGIAGPPQLSLGEEARTYRGFPSDGLEGVVGMAKEAPVVPGSGVGESLTYFVGEPSRTRLADQTRVFSGVQGASAPWSTSSKVAKAEYSAAGMPGAGGALAVMPPQVQSAGFEGPAFAEGYLWNWQSGDATRSRAKVAGSIQEPSRESGATAALRPPAGPWDGRDAALTPPVQEGVPAEAAATPPQGPIPESAPPSLQGGRPAQDDLEAYKQAVRGPVPVDQWRTPKPEVPGAPGQRGGRGLNISAAAAALEAFQVSNEERRAAARQVEFAKRLVSVTKGRSGRALELLEDSLQQQALADAGYDAALTQWLSAKAAGGSQAFERASEELDRELDRELERFNTRPNYQDWKTGRDVMSAADGAREAIRALESAAKSLRGKAHPALLKDLRDKIQDLKEKKKTAKDAGKDAKNVSKSGSTDESGDAGAKAIEAAKAMDDALEAAQEALALAQKKDPGSGHGGGVVPVTGGTEVPPDDGSPPPPEPTGIYPDCGDPLVECGDIELDCMPGERIKCHFEQGMLIVPPGSKGKGVPAIPGDSVPGPEMGPSAVAPEGSGLGTSAPGQGEISAPATGADSDSETTDSQGNEYIPFDSESTMFFPSTGALAVKHFGEWLLLPNGVVKMILRPGSDPPYIDMARFEDAVLAAARARVMKAKGLDSFDGGMEDFDRKFGVQLSAERSTLLDKLRITESDLKFSIPLKEALKATGKAAKEFAEVVWNVASFVPGMETVVDVVDLVAGAVEGDKTTVAFAAAGLFLPVSGRAARELTEVIVDVGRKIPIGPGSRLRKQLLKGLEKGFVELPFDEKLGRRLTLAEVDAHHMLPLKYRKEFEALGIDVQRYGAWWERGDHQRLAWQYNNQAERMIEKVNSMSNSGERLKEIAGFMEGQAREHALTVYLLGA